MNPVFQLPALIPLAVLAAGLLAFAAWRGSGGLGKSRRALLVFLRLSAVAAVLGILFNPGHWARPSDQRLRPWLVLADVSPSMNQPSGEAGTRRETAQNLIREAAARAESTGVPLRVHPFSDALGAAVSPGPLPPAGGDSTRLVAALSQALQDAAAAGESLAGVIVLGDGRETSDPSAADLEAIALRARSRDVAVNTVVIGAGAEPPDLVLVQNRATVTAFPGQPLRIPFALKSAGLDPLRATVTLRDAAGAEISQLQLDVPPGKTVTGVFEAPGPDATTRWSMDTPVIPGEVRRANNSAAFNVRVVRSKTRVFLAEGAPYWDSKFLAQLLRQQPQMEVRSVHRLSENRYFRIDSGSDDPSETDHPVFPASLDELARYDLVVFGKNVDPFLTPDRVEALRAYVRDRGGAVLFARGKPTTGEVPGLDSLEPVVWSAGTATDFRFAPTADGEAAGLFGEALPAPDAALWTSLPPLTDGRQISLVKPFTRVLAQGRPAGATGAAGDFPALLVRRYGQGVAGLVNADGLWKWDFYPEARELGNCYEDFWIQLIQWMASYSEFLPGQDFSMRFPSNRGRVGTPAVASLSYRGPAPVPQPVILVTAPSGAESRLQPAALADPSGRPTWRASFTPDAPGDWKLKLLDPREKSPAAPEVTISVPHPPQESDDLSPDPQFLKSLAEATGGVAMVPAEFAGFLSREMTSRPPVTRESGAVWRSSWNRWWVAVLIAGLFGLEWFLRRREGLA